MKVALVSYTHPDFLPPVYEFYKVLEKRGHQVSIVCTESVAKGSEQFDFRILSVANTYGNGVLGKLRYRRKFANQIGEVVDRVDLVISFCEVSYLFVEKHISREKTRHFHHSLEMLFTSLKDFKRSPLSTLRRMRFLNRIKSCEFVSTPSYERSGWLTCSGRLNSAAQTILNCQYVENADLEALKDKFNRKSDRVTIIHTGGVTHTRSVLELVKGFHLANLDSARLVITNLRDNDYCREISKYVNENSLTNVELLGPISRKEMISIQKDGDIGVCFMKSSELIDTQMLAPNKIGEYLKYGLVVLASESPYFDLFGEEFFTVANLNVTEEIALKLNEAVVAVKNKKNSQTISILKWYNMEFQMRHLLAKISIQEEI